MAYDPKRPRPSMDEEAPAPVDAILDTGTHPAVGPEPASEPAPASEQESGAEPEPPAAESESAAESDQKAGTEASDQAGTDRSPMSVHAGPGAGSGPTSEVPVAPPPVESTVNRAVMVAAFVAALLSVVVLFWLRRRSRR